MVGGGGDVKMEEHLYAADEVFIASPFMKSYETTPERHFSSLSGPVSVSSIHTSSTSDDDEEDEDGEEGSEGTMEPPSSFGLNNADEDGPKKGRSKKNKKLKRKSSSFAYRIRDHVKLGPKLSETVKGKLRLGAKIIQEGGRENIFKQVFGMNEGEKLLKASQCYLSTTAGPIAGLLFSSTQKIAFCSERSIAIPTSTGQIIKTPYKVLIPTWKIKDAYESENINKPEQKYIEIVTEDGHNFWFMGFLRYKKAFRKLKKAISIAKGL
ncbi:hypothetical protein SAY87_003618 [Trapa incisa]|uniref:GRAM domain-containing protein n=2 Tax=Trapa TaxID=22665 RepID=A0AAN7L6F3_TRANT|nr:hypothetical protein SAY87_003618 [Trapa incisa]KAK4778454.1 hypothetical protein SAY86_005982 [Trapa natans]